MNERITLLALKASDPKTGWLDRQKFAELIVRECVNIVAGAVDHREPASTYVDKIKKHFGVEE